MSNKADSKYKIELLIERPSGLCSREEAEFFLQKGLYPHSHLTGHAKICFNDGESETLYGFSCATALALISPVDLGVVEKVERSSKKITSKQKWSGSPSVDISRTQTEKNFYWDDKVIYNVSKEQFDKAVKKAEKLLTKPPFYSLLAYNCVDFAYSLLKAGGIKPPTKMLISMPRFSAIKIRKMEAKYLSVKKSLDKEVKNLGTIFSKDKKAPLEKQDTDEKTVPISLLTKLKREIER